MPDLNISTLIDPHELIGFARYIANEIEQTENETLARWLPVQTIPSISYEYEVETTPEATTARFRAWDAETPITSRETSLEVKTGKLLPISLQTIMSEQDLLRAQEMGTSDLVDLVYANTQYLVQAVLHRAEWQRGEVMVDDQVKISENRLDLNALTFGRPATHQGTAATVWSDPTALMVDEILQWERFYFEKTGRRVGAWLTSSDVRYEMVRNNHLRELTRGPDLSSAMQTISFDEMEAQLARYEVAPIVVYDKKLPDRNEATGVITNERVIARDKFIALPADTIGSVMMGPTIEAASYQLGNAAPGIMASAHWGYDAVNRSVKVNATMLTVAGRSSDVMVFDVLNP